MLYDTMIRHSRQIRSGDGFEHWLESKLVEANDEEEAFLKIRQTPYDSIACIDSWHHIGLEPFSVETGNPEFFTAVHRPELGGLGPEPRVG